MKLCVSAFSFGYEEVKESLSRLKLNTMNDNSDDIASAPVAIFYRWSPQLELLDAFLSEKQIWMRFSSILWGTLNLDTDHRSVKDDARFSYQQENIEGVLVNISQVTAEDEIGIHIWDLRKLRFSVAVLMGIPIDKQTLEMQANNLKDISSKYEHDWAS
ncbi:transducin/WD40 repeat-like superfamily protein [Striga asiatica]|uniref:Transducin/WD40 repeat-like superfamily protein n=1 Tax=Striga asiatica TaxID=4170 RepID=A0A5A7R7M6_STRAF|nr:transducin/WD40 repeat-like superfamily protein [Striga asiatica]